MSEKTAGQVYKKNIGSVVFVSTQEGGQGSGVVVGDNEIATNCHVVADGSPIAILQPGDGEAVSSKRFPARIIASSLGDLCLLKTEGLSAPQVEIGESKSLDVGDLVYAIGNPNGIYGTLSDGVVAQVHPNDIQTTTALAGGSSGGGLFNHEGRLVGITTGRLGSGESAHGARRVELIGHLRQRVKVESPLHDELIAVLNAPLPDQLRDLADKIVASFSEPLQIAQTQRFIGCHEVLLGDKKAAGSIVKSMCALAESQSGDVKDLILVEAVHVSSDMREIKYAVKLAEGIQNEICRLKAFAHIVRELARENLSEARKLYDEHIPPQAMLDEADFDIMGEVANTRAAMEDSEEALRIADKMLRQRPDEAVEALARIAYELRKQKVAIGSTAIFHFAQYVATEMASPNVVLTNLTIVAYHAAHSGDRNASKRALSTMHSIQEQVRHGGGDYRDLVFRTGLLAEVHALLGDVPGAVEYMKRIHVLGDSLAPALACAALMMKRKIRQRQ